MSNPKPLLPLVAKGDQDAVAECLDRYANLVWSLARRFISQREEAEDAVQEIFIDLWSSASRFDINKASEVTFVATLARRRLIDRLRKKRREPFMDELENVAHTHLEEPIVVNEIENRQQAKRATRLIRDLRPEQQRVIKMAIHDGETHKEISESLGMPLGTVKTHLRRGLLNVRTAMQAHHQAAQPTLRATA